MNRLLHATLLVTLFPTNAWADDPKPTFLGPTDEAIRQGHVVPVDKAFARDWLASLTARGDRKVYRGDELFTIGMPCGGIGAGQLYVRGDGTLAKWWLFNDEKNERHCSGYQTYRPESPVDQGFVLRICVLSFPTHRERMEQGLEDIRAAVAEVTKEAG